MSNRKHSCQASPLARYDFSTPDIAAIAELMWGVTSPAPSHWTYRCYDVSSRLLYVGYTSRFLQRFAWHSEDSNVQSWFHCVREVRMQRWCCKDQGMQQEAYAIHTESPVKNLAHNMARLGGIPVKGCSHCLDHLGEQQT